MCQILPLTTWQSATSASAAHGGLLRFVFFLFVISPQDKSDFKMESGQGWRLEVGAPSWLEHSFTYRLGMCEISVLKLEIKLSLNLSLEEKLSA